MTAALDVADLSITYVGRRSSVEAVRGVSLTIEPGRCVGLVGESGSGKSTLGLAIQGLLAQDRTVTSSGSVEVDGVRLDPTRPAGWETVRGHRVTTVFQDPMTSLDPAMTIGRMLAFVTGDKDEALRWLGEVEIRDAATVASSYPHQLSGGMRQRVMIALALARRPALLVADEPTTALDVSVQAQILRLLRRERERLGFGVLFITHDLGVARSMCEDVAVMRYGRIVEQASAEHVFGTPTDPYTRRLVSSRLTLATDRARPLGMPEPTVVASMAEALAASGAGNGADGRAEVQARWESGDLSWDDFASNDDSPPEMSAVLDMRDVTKSFATGGALFRKPKTVLHDVTLWVDRRESVALVGESGSGKSTILRIAAGLEKADSGIVRRGPADEVQVVFQDAGASLTPWLTVEQLLLERVRRSAAGRRMTPDERRACVLETVERVALEPALLRATPGQLSGGQRQRVAIARAIVIPPALLLCDEPTSALDVSVACTVLNLVSLLRHTLGISILFVTHDLAAARVIADRVVVISEGRIVESVPSEDLQDRTTSDYGRRLLDAVLA